MAVRELGYRDELDCAEYRVGRRRSQDEKVKISLLEEDRDIVPVRRCFFDRERSEKPDR